MREKRLPAIQVEASPLKELLRLPERERPEPEPADDTAIELPGVAEHLMNHPVWVR